MTDTNMVFHEDGKPIASPEIPSAKRGVRTKIIVYFRNGEVNYLKTFDTKTEMNIWLKDPGTSGFEIRRVFRGIEKEIKVTQDVKFV